MLLSCLYIADTDAKGRGVFTEEDIAANTVIEVSPVIVMTGEERILLDKTLLHDYIFVWGKNHDQCCMALGYISVYNHSVTANCEHFMNYDEETMLIQTMRDIDAGEELTINYNGDWNNADPLWFKPV